MKHKIAKYSLLILNIFIIVFAFGFVAWLKSGTKIIILKYIRSLLPFIVIWIGSAMWGQKFSIKTVENGYGLIKRILKCNLIAVVIVLGLMYLFNKFYYSRYIVFGTITFSTAVELFIFLGVYYTFSFHKVNAAFASTKLVTQSLELEDAQTPKFFINAEKAVPILSNEPYFPPFTKVIANDALLVPLVQKHLLRFPELFAFINDYIDLVAFSNHKTLILESESYDRIGDVDSESYQIFINLHKINDFRRVNFYLIKVNEILQDGGVFVCCAETIAERRNSFCERFTPYLGLFFYVFDFIFQRVIPKIPIVQGWYFAITKGRNRALSETEILGRFYFCGFDLIHKKELHEKMFFILRKLKQPSTNPNPTYGPLIRLKRKGKGGKVIYIKKLRTMHPYAEYLQDYVYKTSDLQDGGKFRNDFRITSWGKIFRKLWIDELPQIINLFKGEVSLVGVRALSEHYFNLYPADVQDLRSKVKPGLIPPFYADMPVTFDDIVESERRYINRKLVRPFRTDWVYFWRAFWNIAIKHARSN